MDHHISRMADSWSLFEGHPLPLVAFDLPTLHIREVNDTAVAAYGFTREAFRKMVVGELAAPEDVPEQERISANATEQWSAPCTLRHRRSDGTTIMMETVVRLFDFSGRRVGMLMADDVTERLRIERAYLDASTEWRTTFDAMSDAVALLDREGKIRRCNGAMTRLTGRPYADLLGRPCGEVCTCGGEAGEESEGCPFRRTRSTLARSIRETAQGERKFEIIADPLIDAAGGFGGAVLIIKDITERKLLEEQLRQAQVDWENTFNSITDMVTVHDRDYNIMRANKAAHLLLQLPLLQPDTERKCFNYYHGTDRPPAGCPSCECAKTGQPALFELYEPHLGMFIEVRAIPRFDGNGAQIGMVHIVRDITERKRSDEAIERHHRQIQALYTASNRLMASPNLPEIYQQVCDVVLAAFDIKLVWLGIPEQEGRRVRPVAHAGRDDGYLEAITVTWDESPTGRGPTGTAVRTGKVVIAQADDPVFPPWSNAARERGFATSMAVPLQSPSGSCIATLNFYGAADAFTQESARLAEIFANQAAIAIENARLVTGLEQAVQDRTRELEDVNNELTALNRELEERRKEAEAASRSKSDFLSNMSHELRTPLNAIMGFTDLMRMNLAGPVTEKQAEFLRDISASAGHLLSLINNILDLSKVEAGKLEIATSRFNLRETIEGTLVMFKERALKHAIRVVIDAAENIGDIMADQRMVKQVLANLLSNAFKFTPDGGEVRVSARRIAAMETARPAIELSVADSGIGIAPENLQRLFQPFQQVDTSLSRKHHGAGLGLSLSRRMVELHGGTIRAQSEPGRGSVFTFTLPQ